VFGAKLLRPSGALSEVCTHFVHAGTMTSRNKIRKAIGILRCAQNDTTTGRGDDSNTISFYGNGISSDETFPLTNGKLA